MSSFKYFPISEKQKAWGIYLTDCGHAMIQPGEAYPPSAHPNGYYFTWQKGRRLNEYQLLYIREGNGTFEREGDEPRTIVAGDLVLLAPGVWHRYRPEKKTGWQEDWIGFAGSIAEHVMAPPFFPVQGEVIKLQQRTEFETAMRGLIDGFLGDASDLPYTSGARVLELLGLIQEIRFATSRDKRHERAVRQAQFYIGRHVAEQIDFHALAERLGLGYTVFRRNFAEQSGLAPLQYQLAFRLRRAKNLLANTDMSVAGIARATGFKTIFYFSRFFQKQTSISARAYRRQNATNPAAAAAAEREDEEGK